MINTANSLSFKKLVRKAKKKKKSPYINDLNKRKQKRLKIMNLLKNKNKKYIKITIRTLSFQTYFILLEEASGIWYTYPQQLTVLIATNSLENNLALYIQNDKNFDTVIPLLEIWCNKAKINQKQQYLWQEERKEERRVGS